MSSLPSASLRRLALAAVLAFPLLPAGVAGETQVVVRFSRTVSKEVGYTYLLALPKGYDAAADRRWPLLVFLHGSGERGTDPWRVAKHGPPKLLRGDAAAPPEETAATRASREASTRMLAENFIVVSPQCAPRASWDNDGLRALLEEIEAKHKVDATRVYLAGLSMGGYGTWSHAMKNPGRFAAIVPICGGGEPAAVRRIARTNKAELMSLGVWVFHGARDPTVPLKESQRMVDALNQAGKADVRFTIYPEALHDSWTETFNNPELYSWLLQHRRAPAPATTP